MKPKLKLNKKLIQQFFVDHTEKIVFGVFFIAFALLVYGAFDAVSHESYKSVPANLQDSVTQATKHIDAGPQSKEAQPAVMLRFSDFATTVRNSQKDVDAAIYPMNVPMFRTPVTPRRLRGMPQVLQVRELKATAGRGAVAFKKKSAEGESVTRGTRWISVVGLVPVRDQAAEFKSDFDGATFQDPVTDVPNYEGFYVQREEVGPGASAESKWSKFYPFNSTIGQEVIAVDWIGQAAEVADHDVAKPDLCSPLPQRSDGEWGAEAAHLPEIKALAPEDRVGTNVPTDGGGRNIVPTVRPSMPMSEGQFMAPPRRTPRHNDPDRQPPAVGQTKAAEPASPEYYLLRYVDFDVEPGKQYRYRVFLELDNPNYIEKSNSKYDEFASYVTDPKFRDLPFLGIIQEIKDDKKTVTGITIDEKLAKWSDPSPAVTIPDDVRLLAADVKPPKGNQPEPNGSVHVIKWIEESGIKAHDDPPGFNVMRGSMADFPNFEFKVPEPVVPVGPAAVGGAHPFRGEGGMREGAGREGAFREGAGRVDSHPAGTPGSKIDVSYTTDSIILDMDGGGPITPGSRDKTLLRPGRILIMDKNGSLVIHDAVDDAHEFAEFSKAPSDAPPAAANGGTNTTVPPKPGGRNLLDDDSGAHRAPARIRD